MQLNTTGRPIILPTNKEKDFPTEIWDKHTNSVSVTKEEAITIWQGFFRIPLIKEAFQKIELNSRVYKWKEADKNLANDLIKAYYTNKK